MLVGNSVEKNFTRKT